MEKIVCYTSETKVACYGEEGSKHPLIYLDLQKDGRVICPYCGVMFACRGAIDDTES